MNYISFNKNNSRFIKRAIFSGLLAAYLCIGIIVSANMLNLTRMMGVLNSVYIFFYYGHAVGAIVVWFFYVRAKSRSFMAPNDLIAKISTERKIICAGPRVRRKKGDPSGWLVLTEDALEYYSQKIKNNDGDVSYFISLDKIKNAYPQGDYLMIRTDDNKIEAFSVDEVEGWVACINKELNK